VAESLQDTFADGVWYVSLAAIRDPDLVAPTIARALQLWEVRERRPVELLKEHLHDKQVLLVLDNFEHVRAAALAVAELLETCSDLHVLITSRAPLDLRAEQEFEVPPLALPDSERALPVADLSRTEAAALFVMQSQATKPDFTLTVENAATVAEICRRIDGLPLAIELAAARIKYLPPQALLARLERRLPVLTGGPRDFDSRQQTMRAAIAWSYDLLSPEEQSLFRRLAVFVGGFALDAAEAVVNVADTDVLDGVVAHVDQSLLRQGEGPDGVARFTMLETIREFGLEQLQASGEVEATRAGHADWYLGLAKRAFPALLFGEEQSRWLSILATEHNNLRAALAWLETAGEVEKSLDMAGALAPFWYFHSHLAEGSRWLERALARGGGAPPAIRAWALGAAGLIARYQGDYQHSSALAEESLALYRDLGDQRNVAMALFVLGVVAEGEGYYEQAQARYEEALSAFQAAGTRPLIALTLFHLGAVAYGRGNLPRASTLLEEAEGLFREAGNLWGVGAVLAYRAFVAGDLGQAAQAAAWQLESLALFQEVGFREGLIYCLTGLASLAVPSQPNRAGRLFGAIETICNVTGYAFAEPARTAYERGIAAARGRMGNAGLEEARVAGRALSIDEAIAEAMALAHEVVDRARS